jgi:hypothetical protein
MFIVNMNRPGFLPEYEGMECDTLASAATVALDIIDGDPSPTTAILTDDRDLLIDLENMKDVPVHLPLEIMAGDFVVFIAKED